MRHHLISLFAERKGHSIHAPETVLSFRLAGSHGTTLQAEVRHAESKTVSRRCVIMRLADVTAQVHLRGRHHVGGGRRKRRGFPSLIVLVRYLIPCMPSLWDAGQGLTTLIESRKPVGVIILVPAGLDTLSTDDLAVRYVAWGDRL